MNCIFCDILAGKLPAHFLYRDDNVAAFLDIQPVNPGHVLVIPVRHTVEVSGLTSEEGAAVFSLAQQITVALRQSGLRCEGVNYFLADGEAAGQEVFHLHLHVFPRFAGDGFGLQFAESYFSKPEFEDLKYLAAQIKAELRST